MQVHDLRNREPQQRQENPLGRMAQVIVLHRRAADDRVRPHGVVAQRHGGDVHFGIVVRERVKAGVVAERPLEHQLVARVDVPFDDDLGFGGDFEVGRHGFGQPHRLPAQESGEQKLVDRRRQRRRSRVDAGRIAAQRDRDGHRLPALRHHAPVRGAHLVALPVHRQLVFAEDLDAVHPHIPDSRLRIPRNDSTERDVWPAVLGPADRRRELREVDVGVLEDRILARRSSDRLGRELRHLREARQQREFAEQPLGNLEGEQLRNARAYLVEAVDAEGERHAPLRTEQVDRHGMAGLRTAAQRRMREQQRRSAARRFHAAVGDFGDFLVDRYWALNAHEIARVVDRADELAQVSECHNRRRKCRR